MLLTVFLVAEWRQNDPMLDLTLFSGRPWSASRWPPFTLSASIFALFLYLTLYIQDDLGYGPLQPACASFRITVLAFMVAPIAGKLTVRIQTRYLLGTGLLLVGIGCLLMADHPRLVDLDRAAARVHHRRHRDRDGQPGARLVRDLGGPPGAQRHGLRHQQHLPAGRDRHRHRRARLDLPVARSSTRP